MDAAVGLDGAPFSPDAATGVDGSTTHPDASAPGDASVSQHDGSLPAGDAGAALPNGSTCGSNEECSSGHCAFSTCCEGGDCCTTEATCPPYYSGPAMCSQRQTCQGTRTAAACDPVNFRCQATVVQDDSACTSTTVAATCPGDRVLTCNGAVDQVAPACSDACSQDAECGTGRWCDVNVCKPMLGDGLQCSRNGACSSQHCANQFCCSGGADCCSQESDCPASYSQAAVCDTAASCQGHRVAATCIGHACGSATLEDDSACDGTVKVKDCVEAAPVYCSGDSAQPQAHVCGSACTSSDQCLEGRHCDPQSSRCVDKVADGLSCSANADCLSGRCANQHCCLEGDCCSVAQDCPSSYRIPATCDSPATCQGSHLEAACDAATHACKARKVDDDSACTFDVSTLSCPRHVLDRTCNGQTQQLAPWCTPTCSTNADCKDGTQCLHGFCAYPPGSACQQDNDCDTYHCVNNVCCMGTNCCTRDEQCEHLKAPPTCAEPWNCQGYGYEGQCDQSNKTCRARMVPDDSPCGAESRRMLCAPYANSSCNNETDQPTCQHSCQTSADCEPNFTCLNQQCTPMKQDGQTCSVDAECWSDHCNSGLCCKMGDCCTAVTDCPATYGLPRTCENPLTCQGYWLEAMCISNSCYSFRHDDDSACDATIPPQTCFPYKTKQCTGSVDQYAVGCQEPCGADSDCAAGAYCTYGDGICHAKLENGAWCNNARYCQSGFCSSTYRCAPPGELGCASVADCPAYLNEPLQCDSPTTCQGHLGVVDCVGAVCVRQRVEDDAACTAAYQALTCGTYPDVKCTGAQDQPAAACATSCNSSADCKSPNYCDAANHCVPRLANGSACTADGQCSLGHCQNGFCCLSGDCCSIPADCSQPPPECNNPGSCQGVRWIASCDQGRCEQLLVSDDTACTSTTRARTCSPYKDVYCNGTSNQSAPAACNTTCNTSADCQVGQCNGGVCSRPDGDPCNLNSDCASSHCQNGYCCSGGDCCDTEAHCPASYTHGPQCSNVASCQGHHSTASCNAHVCAAVDVDDDAACTAGLLARDCPSPFRDISCTGELNQTARTCPAVCTTDTDCEVGRWCRGGSCRLAQPDGSECSRASMCASAHCQGGFCCASGDCCGAATDCASYASAASCTNPGTCQGQRTDATCSNNTCGSTVVEDDSACTATTVVHACPGLFQDVRCTGEKSQAPGDCRAGCRTDSDCKSGAYCDGALCQTARSDGNTCVRDRMCSGGHCQNLFCCSSGDCCQVPADCPATYHADAVCDVAATCQGHRMDAACSGYQCGSARTEDDTACTTSTVANTCGALPRVLCNGQADQQTPACVSPALVWLHNETKGGFVDGSRVPSAGTVPVLQPVGRRTVIAASSAVANGFTVTLEDRPGLCADNVRRDACLDQYRLCGNELRVKSDRAGTPAGWDSAECAFLAEDQGDDRFYLKTATWSSYLVCSVGDRCVVHPTLRDLFSLKADACAAGAHDCSPHASCTTTAEGYQCACLAGYTGDGKSCQDADECALGTANCNVHATCTNTEGGFTCACTVDYQGDGVNCQPFDACLGRGPCMQECATVNRAPACRCFPGFDLDPDGTSCQTWGLVALKNVGLGNPLGLFTNWGVQQLGFMPQGERVRMEQTADGPDVFTFTAEVSTSSGTDMYRMCATNQYGYMLSTLLKTSQAANPAGWDDAPCKWLLEDAGNGRVRMKNLWVQSVNADADYLTCAQGTYCYFQYYGGTSGNTLFSIERDPCGCDTHAACALTSTGRTCTCNAGYDGDGTTCTRNPCAFSNGGCAQQCVNTGGVGSCGCFPGFTLSSNGTSCVSAGDVWLRNNGLGSFLDLTQTGQFGYGFGANGQPLRVDTTTSGSNVFTFTTSGRSPAQRLCAGNFGGGVYSAFMTLAGSSSWDAADCQWVLEDMGSGGFRMRNLALDRAANPRGPLQCGTTTDCHANLAGDVSGNTLFSVVVDQCRANNNGCAQLCTTAAGAASCACLPGHRLAADGKSCEPLTNRWMYSLGSGNPLGTLNGALVFQPTGAVVHLDPAGGASNSFTINVDVTPGTCADGSTSASCTDVLRLCATTGSGAPGVTTWVKNAQAGTPAGWSGAGCTWTMDDAGNGRFRWRNGAVDQASSQTPFLECSASGTCAFGNHPTWPSAMFALGPDDCSAGPCDVHARCTNTVSGHDCTCQDGYTGNGQQCSALPCTTNNGGCGQQCTNNNGTAVCSCLPGATLAADGHTCTPWSNSRIYLVAQPAFSLGLETRVTPPFLGFRAGGNAVRVASVGGNAVTFTVDVGQSSYRLCAGMDRGSMGVVTLTRTVQGGTPAGWDGAACTWQLEDRGQGVVRIRNAWLQQTQPGLDYLDCQEDVCSYRPGPNPLGNVDYLISRDECADQLHNCDAHATCTDDAVGFHCTCNTGFAGNGLSCTQVDACVVGNGGCAQTCVNNNMVAVCGCYPGFSLDADGRSCVPWPQQRLYNVAQRGFLDVDLTAASRFTWGSTARRVSIVPTADGPNVFTLTMDAGTDSYRLCVDTAGDFSARLLLKNAQVGTPPEWTTDACKWVFEMAGSGQVRMWNPWLRAQMPSSRYLECDTPTSCFYTFDEAPYGQGSTRFAVDNDECAAGSSTCDAHATCTNSVGSYTCACNRGYLGDGQTCVLDDVCVEGNGGCEQQCTSINRHAACGCYPGFSLAQDGRTCEPWANARLYDVGFGLSMSLAGGGDPPYPYSFRAEPGDVVLASGSAGPNTVTITFPYRPGLCANGSTSYFCPNDYRLCALLENGQYNVRLLMSVAGMPLPSGWDGPGCTWVVDNLGNNQVRFHNMAVAAFSPSQDTLTCMREGVCWFGAHDTVDPAATFMVDLDECAAGTSGCSSNAACTNTMGGRTCTCQDGFFGNGVTCTRSEPCLDNNGGCLQECRSANRVVTCSCFPGFDNVGGAQQCRARNGLRLFNTGLPGYLALAPNFVNGFNFDQAGSKVRLDSPPVAPNAFNLTVDVNPGPCADGTVRESCAQTHRLCAYDHAGFRVRMLVQSASLGTPEAWDGPECTWLLEDTGGGHVRLRNQWLHQSFPYYGYLNCEHNQDCDFTAYDATTLYTDFVIDPDECATGTDDCAFDATCANQDPGFSCACKPGYQGNGVTCSDINECANGTYQCSLYASCSNLPGSYSCTCNSGYYGDGLVCAQVDPCTSNNGGCSQTCAFRSGHAECSCYPGYALGADGTTCTAWENIELYNKGLQAFLGVTQQWPRALGFDVMGEEVKMEPAFQWGPSAFTFTLQSRPGTAQDGSASMALADKHRLCAMSWGGYRTTTLTQSLQDPNPTGWDGAQCAWFVEDMHNGTVRLRSVWIDQMDPGLGIPYHLVCRESSECSILMVPPTDPASVFVLDINECASALNGCSAHAACTNTVGSYTCACNNGYVGDGRSCILDNPCVLDNAGCAQVCTSSNRTATCGCYAGFTLNPDVTTCAPRAGLVLYSEGLDMFMDLFTLISPVQFQFKPSGGKYVRAESTGFGRNVFTFTMDVAAGNGSTDHYRLCAVEYAGLRSETLHMNSQDPAPPDGWSAERCAWIMEPVDADRFRLKNQWVESSWTGFSYFTCPSDMDCGFTMDGRTAGNTVFALAYDVCATGQHQCSPLRSCKNAPGGYVCRDCPTGYTNDGDHACLDINECTQGTAGCDVHATCSNSVGGSTCTCNAGYAGDGKSCRVAGPCEVNNGGCGQLCTPVNGQPQCGCYAGFSLSPTDGKACESDRYIKLVNEGLGLKLGLYDNGVPPDQFQFDADGLDVRMEPTADGGDIFTFTMERRPGTCANGTTSTGCPDSYRLCAYRFYGYVWHELIKNDMTGTPTGWDDATCKWKVFNLGDNRVRLKNVGLTQSVRDLSYMTCTQSNFCSFNYETSPVGPLDGNTVFRLEPAGFSPCHGVTCAMTDQCHLPGYCEASTGLCQYPIKRQGTPCDDGDPQTQNDSCSRGICVGGGDLDGDGVPDARDSCWGDDAVGDTDGDAFCDDLDTCPLVFNRDQADADFDGFGDACDLCPTTASASNADADGNGAGDACDPNSQSNAPPQPDGTAPWRPACGFVPACPGATSSNRYTSYPFQCFADEGDSGAYCKRSRWWFMYDKRARRAFPSWLHAPSGDTVEPILVALEDPAKHMWMPECTGTGVCEGGFVCLPNGACMCDAAHPCGNGWVCMAGQCESPETVSFEDRLQQGSDSWSCPSDAAWELTWPAGRTLELDTGGCQFAERSDYAYRVVNNATEPHTIWVGRGTHARWWTINPGEFIRFNVVGSANLLVASAEAYRACDPGNVVRTVQEDHMHYLFDQVAPQELARYTFSRNYGGGDVIVYRDRHVKTDGHLWMYPNYFDVGVDPKTTNYNHALNWYRYPEISCWFTLPW